MGAIDPITQESARGSSGTDRVVEQRLRRVVSLLLAFRYLWMFCGAAFIAWEAYEILSLTEGIRLHDMVEIVLIGVLGPLVIWVTSTWVAKLANGVARSYWKLSASHRTVEQGIVERKLAEEAA